MDMNLKNLIMYIMGGIMHNCNFCDKEFNILDQLGHHIMNTHVKSGEARRFMEMRDD